MAQSQGTPISIKLRTKVMQNGEHQDFFFDLKGQMVKIGDTLYIRYQEIQENTAEEIPVTIKLVPDGHVQLIGHLMACFKLKRIPKNYMLV